MPVDAAVRVENMDRLLTAVRERDSLREPDAELVSDAWAEEDMEREPDGEPVTEGSMVTVGVIIEESVEDSVGAALRLANEAVAERESMDTVGAAEIVAQEADAVCDAQLSDPRDEADDLTDTLAESVL